MFINLRRKHYMEEFIKDRNDAFASGDINKIKEYRNESILFLNIRLKINKL